MPPQDPFNLAHAKDSLNKGHHWYLRGCHREAIRFFDEGLAYARLSDAAPLIVMGHNSLGTALLAQGNLKAAAEKLAEALDLALTLPERPELDRVIGNLGALAFKAKKKRQRRELLGQSLRGRRRTPERLFTSLIWLASIRPRTGRPSSKTRRTWPLPPRLTP
jgi:tetratricopeptide (TPR) repeat protein